MRQEFQGVLKARDQKTHVAYEVSLAQEAQSLALRLSFPRGRGYHHMLCLSVFDSAGFRGSGHRGGSAHDVGLSSEQATPGYLPGPIPAGTLRIVIHAHRIAEGEPCPYQLVVEWEEHRGARAARPALAPDLKAGSPVPEPVPGWYRGDLHTHTVHSDGDWDIPGLLAAAREAGLDFISITDHNTISQLLGLGDRTDGKPLVIPGMELTTFRGHALSLGTRSWIDWGALVGDRSMSDIAAEVAGHGGLFVIAHPLAEGDPSCTGCDWRFSEMTPGTAPAVEIWNGPWIGDSHNDGALRLWYGWLNEGKRLVATAGSDAHGPQGFSGSIGRNVVWSQGCYPAAILQSIAAGHLYLSCGPHLELSAIREGQVIGMGDAGAGSAVPARTTGSAEARLRWKNCPPGAVARLVTDGVARAEVPAEGEGTRRWDEVRVRWCTAEIRDREGALLAVTNPVYLQPRGPVAGPGGERTGLS